MSAADSFHDFDVTGWLQELGLSQYADGFARNEVTGDMLPQLDDDDLKSIGVNNLGDRKRLRNAIAELRAVDGASQTLREAAPVAPAPTMPALSSAHMAVRDASPVLAEKSADSPKIASQSVTAAPALVPTALPPPSWQLPASKTTVRHPTPDLAPLPTLAVGAPKRRGFWAAVLGGNFLIISIIVHVLFGLGATYYIVQRVQAKRKLTFQAGPPSPNASKRALEHKVSMAQKKKSGGAPPQAKRIVSSGLAKVSLPDMPALPTATTIAPSMMAGLGGAGFGQGMGFGNGMGMGSGGGGGGGGMTMFGFHSGNAGGLVGEFYDLKQKRNRQDAKVDNPKYGAIVSDFIKKGWQDSILHEYYKAPLVLYGAQWMIPDIDANLAPQAFQVEKEVKPERWLAHYKGRVLAPETGHFHFVGGGDDILLVKFNGRTVLNGCWAGAQYLGGDDHDKVLGTKTEGRYNYNWPERGGQPLGFAKGEGFDTQEGQSYPIEILIGEWPGGRSHFVLMIEKSGATYKKTATGAPILPAFRVAEGKPPKLEANQTLPPHLDDGPVWRAQAGGTGSLLDALKR